MSRRIELAGILLGLGCTLLVAQEEITAPSLSQMEGDYIIINSKEYEEVKSIADMKAMEIGLSGDSLVLSGFYMNGSYDMKAGYDERTGNISIPAGLRIFDFGDGQGSIHYLYAWDEEKSEVIMRPIVYRYKGNDIWETDVPLMLMIGVEGQELSPYYFSQGSKICKANATTENVSYVGYGTDQQVWEESRPSYLVMEGNKVTVFNLLQTDMLGYGCRLELTYDSNTGKVAAPPSLIGQVTDLDYPYRALTGCVYNENENKPIEANHAGTAQEGVIEGVLDMEKGTMELDPVTIWPAKYDTNGWFLDYSRYYEFIKTIKVAFELQSVSSIGVSPYAGKSKGEIVRVEYYSITGQKLAAPVSDGFSIRKTYYKDNRSEVEKIYWR